MPKAWQDLAWWLKQDRKQVLKIHGLLASASKTPFEGIGQPEPLKANYSGYWSRRINLEHRLIYKVEERQIIVHFTGIIRAKG